MPGTLELHNKLSKRPVGMPKGRQKISYTAHNCITRVSVSKGNDHNGMVRIFVGVYELIMVITSHTTSHTDCMMSYS